MVAPVVYLALGWLAVAVTMLASLMGAFCFC